MALKDGVQTEEDFFNLQQKALVKRDDYDEQTDSYGLAGAREDGSNEPLTSLPSYLRASAAHAIASGDLSPISAEADTPIGGMPGAVAGALAGARLGGAFAGLPGVIGGAILGGATGYDWRYAADAVISGTSQLVNGGINLVTFGQVPDAIDTDAVIASLDDDLSAYYVRNKESVDAGGFLVSSIIPGLGGVKALNWGSKVLDTMMTGVGGRGLMGATGLLQSTHAGYLAAAEAEFLRSGVTYSLINQNVLKAVGTKAVSNALEFAAFETGVQAIMAPSPMLNAQDAGDIGTNIFTSGMVGGAFGLASGVLGGSYKIMKRLHIDDLERRGAEFQKGVAPGTSFDAHYVTNVQSIEDVVTKGAGFDQAQIRTISSIDDKNRALVQGLASIDKDVANTIHQELNFLGKDAPKVVMGMTDAANVNTVTALELELDRLAMKVDAGIPLAPDETTKMLGTSIKYLTLWGENTGTLSTSILDAAGTKYQAWDLLQKGNRINVLADEVNLGMNSGISHKIDFSAQFSLMEHLKSTKDVAVANLRDVWAATTEEALPEGLRIGVHDPALLRKAAKEVSATRPFSVVLSDGAIVPVNTPEQIHHYLKQGIDEVAAVKIAEAKATPKGTAGRLHEEAVASALGIKTSALRGTGKIAVSIDDLHALDAYAAEYAQRVGAVAKLAPSTREGNILLMPRRAKVVYDTSRITDEDILSIPLITRIKQEQVLLQQQADLAVHNAVGGDIASLLPEGDFAAVESATRNVGAAGIITPADYALGSTGSFWQRVGNIVSTAKTGITNKVISTLDAHIAKLHGNTGAAVHFGTIQNDLQSTAEQYYLVRGRGLVRSGIVQYEEALAAGKQMEYPTALDPTAKDVIAIKPEYADIIEPLLEAHRELTTARSGKFDMLRKLVNSNYGHDPRAIYFPPPNLHSYPNVALVSDPRVVGAHGAAKRMLYAATPEELEQLIAAVPDTFRAGIMRKPIVTSKAETEAWFSAIKEYREQDALTQGYFNAAFQRSGVAARYVPQSDSQLIGRELKEWHIAMEHNLIREAISSKYAKEFYELRALGEKTEQATTSIFAVRGSAADQTSKAMVATKNPYTSYIRTALDLSAGEALPLTAFQDWADKAVSNVWDTFAGAFKRSTSIADLDIIAREVDAAGIKTIDINAYNMALGNHSLPQGALATFSRRMNAILSSVILKPSVLNAMLNYVGSAVLLAPETEHVLSLMREGNKELLGELAHVTIPGTEHTYLSTTKLVGRAIKRAGQQEWREWGSAKGFNVRTSLEMSLIEDAAALTGKESGLDLNTRLTVAYNKAMGIANVAERVTGNSLAESMTRLTSALVMEELTSPLVASGRISAAAADTYIQTFVNRVNGVYQTSQRPLLFRGPIGQSLGLFQTYMVTLGNNILRHSTEGSLKSVALMGLAQGTIHGMASLPGFQQLNTNLVGSFSGNKDHKDIFSLAYNTVDKNMADWMLYGALSNTLGLLHPDLKINMYTRGDANPRNVSIVPLLPTDYPIVSIGAKMFGNLVETFDRMNQDGVPVGQTVLTALEHNGVSRELSGIAQVLQGTINESGKSYSTSKHGNLVASSDLFSLMNVGRLLGAKHLDVAKAADEVYRTGLYQARDADMIASLGAGIKDKIRSGGEVTFTDVTGFQSEYVKRGGSIENFSKYWMDLYKDANIAQANQMTKNLKSQEAQDMLVIMGGRKPEWDF